MRQRWVSRSVWAIVIGWMVVGIVAGGLVNLFLPAQYESAVTAYVLPSDANGGSGEQYQASLLITDRLATYADIAHSPAVLDTVSEELGSDLTTEDLAERTAVTTPEGTSLLVFTARDRDPAQAQRLAAALAGSAVATLDRLEKGTDDSSAVTFVWVSPANNPTVPALPNRLVSLGVGAAAGMLLGLGIVVLPLLRAVVVTDGRVHVLVLGPLANRIGAGTAPVIDPTAHAPEEPAAIAASAHDTPAHDTPAHDTPAHDTPMAVLSGSGAGEVHRD